MKNITTILISFIIILSRCNCVDNRNEFSSWTQTKATGRIENFINYLYEYPNTKHIDSVYYYLDSLVRINPRVVLANWKAIDSTKAKYWFKFYDLDSENCNYYLIKRNSFVITVSNGLILHDYKTITIDQIEKEINKIMKTSIETNTTPQIKISEIDYFGNVQVSKMVIVMDTNFEQIGDNNAIDWSLYIKTLTRIYEIYHNLWKEKSKEFWQCDFSNLDFNKQLALLEYYPFSVELNFVKRTFKE